MARKKELGTCIPVVLPEDLRLSAAFTAIKENPVNSPAGSPTPEQIAAMTGKYWGSAGKKLTVGFLEETSEAFRSKFFHFANKWSEHCNFSFVWTQSSPEVRVTRNLGGYWSYLGTDCLQIPQGQPTMCLQGFTVSTRESEWERVVVHECGHAMGFPHEHMRRDIQKLLNQAAVIARFMRDQGWSEQQVRQQILITLEEHSLTGASPADPESIMSYRFDGSLTIDGKPIPGGSKISPVDAQYVGKIYPKPAPPPPVSVWPVRLKVVVNQDGSFAVTPESLGVA